MPNRILRDWTQSENVNNISESSEVFFTRLIMKADDFGCIYGNVKLLRAGLYPLKHITDEQIEFSVTECEQNNLIILYVIENKRYIKILNFGQRLRLMKSKYPQPNDGQVSDSCQADDGLKRSRNEVETKRNETNKNELIFDEKYQFYYSEVNGEKLVGNESEIKNGGMSIFAIRKHCKNLGIEYGGEYGE